MAKSSIKKALLDDLAARGLTEPIYTDMVDEYIKLRKLRADLDKEIKKNGVMVFDEKRETNVDNPAVSRRVQVLHQMLAIYAALGFKTIAAKAPAADRGEDDDL